MSKWRGIFQILFTVIAAVFVAGCDDANNHLTLREFADHLKRSGVNVEQVQPVRPETLKAEKAMAIRINGSDIGVYKYNTDVEKQREKVRKIDNQGFVYIIGLKYPVIVKGSFVVIGVHRNPAKRKIVEAIKTFN